MLVHSVGSAVVIDGKIHAVVTYCTLRGAANEPHYGVEWWHEGEIKDGFFAEARVTGDQHHEVDVRPIGFHPLAPVLINRSTGVVSHRDIFGIDA